MKIILYGPVHWRIADEFFEPNQHELIRVEGCLDDMVARVSETSPNLLIVHGLPPEDRFLAELARLCRLIPDAAIVPYLVEPEREYLIKLMRAGVSEVLLDDTQAAVREVLVRVGQKIKKSQRDDSRIGKAIGLISAKGGDGSSLLTANLATALSLAQDMQVLAIDLSLPFGDLDLYMTTATPDNTLVNFSDEVDRLDGSLLRSMVHHVSSQLDLVAAPKVFEEAFRINPVHVRKLMVLAVQEYDYVLVDFGSQIGPFVTQVLDELDELVMVVTATMPSVRHASQMVALWESLEFDVSKVSLVLNRYTDQYNIKPEDLTNAVGRSIAATIPGELPVAEEALLRSVPVVQYDPKCKLSKAIRDWASHWTGMQEPEDKSIWHRLKIR